MNTAVTPSPARGMPPWIIAMAGFMAVVFAANCILIAISSRSPHDLVRPDYYEAGLRQDSLIARSASDAGHGGAVTLRRTGQEWILEAATPIPGATACRLRFYRPDDGRADREAMLQRVPGNAASPESWRMASPALKRGRWIVTAVWERNGLPLREASLNLLAKG